MTRRRTLGIWFYGVIFLAACLPLSYLALTVFRNIILLKKYYNSYPGVYNLYAVGLAVSAFVFLLLGLLTMSRKGHGLILGICVLLTLIGTSVRIWSAYSVYPCTVLISILGSAPVLLFFISTLCFFIRAKTKNQFACSEVRNTVMDRIPVEPVRFSWRDG